MRKALLVLVGVVVVAAVGAGMAAWSLWTRISEPYRGYTAAERFVEIPSGTGTAEIARRLTAAGVVRDETAFRTAVWWNDAGARLQAGEYRFEGEQSAIDVVNRLARGEVFTRRLTFREGLTIAEMAQVYESGGFGTADSFVEAAGNASLVADLDPEATDLEGYLFPETYALARDTAVTRLVAMMVDRFRAAYDEALRAQAGEQGLSTREVVTLASLVEKETGRDDERTLVAAVYRNRLRIGMGMQADPTVIYALQKAGLYDGNIRRADLQFDSPYNTYRYPGLPPGPIAAPGRASLHAALNPADVDYLYFVSRNDGSHVFAETLAEHNRNVREWQVLFFRNQSRASGQGEAGRAATGDSQ